MENLSLYEKFRKVPETAKKPIVGGRLNGKTDINPMWRIKKLTEQFGPVGLGWYYDIVEKWLENGADGVITANIVIDLFVKYDGEWSKPIKGIGGATFLNKEKSGLFTDDNCYKKALTDAISVSCKALGIGADVYYEKDISKYDKAEENTKEKAKEPPQEATIDKIKERTLLALINQKGANLGEILKFYEITSLSNMTVPQFMQVTATLEKRPDKGEAKNDLQEPTQ